MGAQPGPSELTDRAIMDMYDARDIVETEAERRAVPLLGDAGLRDMRAALRTLQQAIAERDPVGMIAGNRAFHFALFERCPNPWLVDLVARLWEVMDPYRAVSYGRIWSDAQDELMADEVLVEHRRILDALSRGSQERALHLLRRHRGRSQAFVGLHAGQHPGGG